MWPCGLGFVIKIRTEHVMPRATQAMMTHMSLRSLLLCLLLLLVSAIGPVEHLANRFLMAKANAGP